jgi:hypothetical protein
MARSCQLKRLAQMRLAEAALVFQDVSAAQEPLELFRVIGKAAHDPTYGGYRIAFTARLAIHQQLQALACRSAARIPRHV